MSDNEAPEPRSASDGAVDAPVTASADRAAQSSTPSDATKPDVGLGPSLDVAGATNEAAAPLPSAAKPRPGRSTRRRALWATVALLCTGAGVAGSLLGARSVARTDARMASQRFRQTSSDTAAAIKLAIQHEEDLGIAATTFFAANPKATRTEFHTWAKWSHTSSRYPELLELRLIALVPAAELAAFRARLSGRAAKPPTAAATSSAAVQAVPASSGTSRCLGLAGLGRGTFRTTPAGLDYCNKNRALRVSRVSGESVYTLAAAGSTSALSIETPVYRGNVRPVTVRGRNAAFVGWVRAVLLPQAVLAQTFRDHADAAARLRYTAHATNVTFTSGTPRAGAQTRTFTFHNGWTLRSFGPPAGAGVPADASALALLIAGCLLSAALGLLILLLGSGRGRAPVRETRETGAEDLYDTLTGLPNRGLTLDLAERMLARTGRQSGVLAGALIIDIDWFKDVNDKLGKAAGDQLLVTVAGRLANVVRAQDTVGRLEGDRFVVLVESAARGVRLDSLARRVIESMHKPVELDGFGPSFFVTASIGIAYGQYTSTEDLLRDSQLALDGAKAAGKDGYTVFNANMRSVIEGRGVLEAELNTALQERQFFLLYQPIRDLTSSKIVGLEAMIRWQHPKRGVIAPGDFLALAEETGLIVPIGRWVLEEACARAAAWNVAGPPVGISVMISANQMNREGFVTDVRRALHQSGIEPALLTLEISESTVMLDVTASAERLKEVRRLGVKIAIDDFGNAYAYRSDLQRLPLDNLKVDRSCLAASDDEDYRNWLLEAILILGRDLSLTVIAKGVETYEQMAALQAMGCTLAQGFFIGEPLGADGVDGLFATARQAALASHAALATPPSPLIG